MLRRIAGGLILHDPGSNVSSASSASSASNVHGHPPTSGRRRVGSTLIDFDERSLQELPGDHSWSCHRYRPPRRRGLDRGNVESSCEGHRRHDPCPRRGCVGQHRANRRDPTFAGLFVIGDPPVIPEGTAGELVVACKAPEPARSPRSWCETTPTTSCTTSRSKASPVTPPGRSSRPATPSRCSPTPSPQAASRSAYIYFEAGDFTGTETFEYQVRASRRTHVRHRHVADQRSHHRRARVVGLVDNPGTDPIPGRRSAWLASTTPRVLTYAYWGRTDGDEIPPGGFAGFTLPSGGDCSAAVLAASG